MVARDDSAEAERLTSDLFRTFDEERRESFLHPDEIPLADVEADIDSFALQLRFASAYDIRIPCLRIEGSLAPIEWTTPPWLDLRWRFPGDPYFYEYLWRDVPGWQDIVTTDPKEALSAFRTNVRNFLTVRLSARRSSIRQSPGLQITVNSLRSGDRVHYTPAYYVKTQLVFGAPSSPVTGWIQPGRYMFGVVSPGQIAPTFDTSAHFDIPPLQTVTIHV